MKAPSFIRLCWISLLLALAACQSTPPTPGMKLGKPYSVDGKTYYPEYDPTYDKIGMASWYGPGFHGKYTASGEIFNQNDLTAAHPTLPMPSLVRVTNLSNGKSLIVRINDRGPFKSNRIIDLSKKAAHELGVTSTAEVRVQFLKPETEAYLASLQSGGARADMLALNEQAAERRDSSIISSTEPGDQVVESTVSNTHAGQTVNNAAPVVTVNAGDLSAPQPVAPSRDLATKPVTLVRDEPAEDENNTPPKKPHVSVASLAVPAAYADEEPHAKAAPTKEEVVEAQEEPAVSRPVPHKSRVEMAGTVPASFYIQAGSFASEDNARKLSVRLQSVSAIDVGKVEMGDKTWWRVRLGPYDSKADAAEALDKVHTAGLPDARIVQQ